MEEKRKVPKNHPALDRFNEYNLSINGASKEIQTYVQLLLEAVAEGSIWVIRVRDNEYEIYADILETKE